jgi:DNA-binding NarL/FixJ family response regulator
MRALIYDTDRLRLATLARNLQDLELEWVAVTAPDKVKTHMGTTQFDLMILDESATGLIRQLRKLDPGVPIIIVVEGDTKLDYEQLFFEGVEGIIARPYRLDFFKKIVDKALAQRKHTLLHLRTVVSLKQKVRELETLNEIVQAISSSLQPREILDIIMEKTAELIKAEGWSLLLLDQEKQELVFEAAAGEAGKKLPITDRASSCPMLRRTRGSMRASIKRRSLSRNRYSVYR